MGVSSETAMRLSNDLIRLMKLMASMRQHAPRLHPGADGSAYPLLFTLLQGPRRVSSLAEGVHSDVSTVSRQVTGLVQHGLLEKLPDPLDGRATILSLTAEGRGLLDRVKHQRGEWFRTVLEGWSEQEAQTCIDSLERLAAGLERSRDSLSMTMDKES